MKEMEGMEKVVSRRGKGASPYLSILKGGWATIRDGLVQLLNVKEYKSLDFFINPNDKGRHIAIVLYKGDRGELSIRHRKKTPTPVGCGFCLIGFIRKHPEYVGRYELVRSQDDKDSLTALLKPVK